MAEKVAQHTHCQICGKAIPISETLCSEECKQKYESMIRKRKMLMYIMYALIFIILIMLILPSLQSG
jgi:predicted nucleic acid-binding Zn ribbon protein